MLVFVGQDDFWRLEAQLQWHQLWKFAGALLFLMLAFAYRWYLLLDEHASLKYALYSTILGLGSNQILPARGGDLIRAAYVARYSHCSPHKAISALALEKIIDLFVVAMMGIGIIVFVAASDSDEAVRISMIFTSVAIISASTLAILLARRAMLTTIVKQAFRRIRVGPIVYRHVYRALLEFSKATRAHKLVWPTAATTFMWFALYVYVYLVVASIAGVHIGYAEALVLVFAGALGLAIPAAPSGLGTFHASIVTGFLLLNRPVSEGFFFAVVLHGLFFIAYVVPAALLYVFIVRPTRTSRAV